MNTQTYKKYKVTIESDSYLPVFETYAKFRFFLANTKDSISKPVVTKTKKNYTLLKSPHVNKTAREQFEVRAYSCLVKVNSTSIVVQDVEQTIQKMVPPGITIKCTNKYVL
jgi:ribosomal protein S10